MSDSNSDTQQPCNREMLPRRDWILMPLIGLATIALVAASTEWIARQLFSKTKTTFESRLVYDDPSKGVRAIPNSTTWCKREEFPLLPYRFNSCGHYAAMDCGPKPQGVHRIVMMGGSFPMGLGVAKETTFASLLPQALSLQTGRKVELYNVSMLFRSARVLSLRTDEVIREDPDTILWIISPRDVEDVSVVLPADFMPQVVEKQVREKPIGLLATIKHRVQTALSLPAASVPDVLRAHFQSTETALMLRHCLYESQSQYVKSYLMGSDSLAGFLRTDPSTEWKRRVQDFDNYDAVIEARAKAAGVPLVVSFFPNRAQAAMISKGEWPEGYDPYKLDGELRSIVTSHGGIYIDILPDFRNISNPEKGYFPVDGHPNPEGHAIIADLLARELTSGAVPGLRATEQNQIVQERGR